MLQNVRKFLPGRRPHVTQLRLGRSEARPRFRRSPGGGGGGRNRPNVQRKACVVFGFRWATSQMATRNRDRLDGRWLVQAAVGERDLPARASSLVSATR